jgi:hypothetical protein
MFTGPIYFLRTHSAALKHGVKLKKAGFNLELVRNLCPFSRIIMMHS